MSEWLRGFSTCALMFVTVTCARAENWDDNGDDGEEYKFAIGAMITANESLYVGGKSDAEMEPGLTGEWGRFFLYGSDLGYEVYEDGHWSINLKLAIDYTRDTDRGDSSLLADMEELDDALLAGLEVVYRGGWGEVTFSVETDVNDTHNGSLLELSYGRPIEAKNWLIEPNVSIAWHSKDAVQYYWGVTAENALPTRPVYLPGDGLVYEMSIASIYPLEGRQALRFEIEVEAFSSAVTDSPIVERDHVFEIGIGYIYRF